MEIQNLQKYSKALLEVAQEQGKIEEILAEVNELIKIFDSSGLDAFFNNEVYPEEAKSQVVDSLNQSASELMRNFLNTVRSNGRLAALAGILQEIKHDANNMFKIADVEVVTSLALKDEQKEKLIHLVKEKFDLNEVKIINRIDEKIIGGFVIQSRGKIIDASIKKQLAKIAQEIR